MIKTIGNYTLMYSNVYIHIYIYILCVCLCVCVCVSTATSEIPEAAGGNPTVEGAPQPERRARQTAGAGD